MYALARLLDRTYYHNSLDTWVSFGVAVLVDVGILVLLRQLVIRRFSAIAERTPTAWDDLVVDLARRTRFLFFLVVGVWAATRLLTIPRTTRAHLRDAAVIVLLVQCGIWANAAIRFWVVRLTRERATHGTSVTTITALGFVARLLLWAVLFLLALENFGVDVTTVVAGLGITGIAVALAIQNVLGDLFAAMSIVLDKPFVIGDSIQVDTFNGDVEYIGLKTTRLRSVSGEQIIFSNAELLRSRIRNYKRMSRRRVVLGLGVVYDTPPDRLERIPTLMRELVASHEHTTFDRSHLVRLGPSAIEFETVYFVESPDYKLHMDIQQAVQLALLRRLRADGIEIAYPTQRLLLERLDGTADGADGARVSPSAAQPPLRASET